jgi:hypothetical protein
LNQRQRGVTGHRLDAPDAGGDAGFGDDLEQADVATAADVHAAAEFLRRADGQHAHFVAVFLAEEHHRARPLRFLDRHDACLGRGIGKNLVIDEVLDTTNLVGGHRRIVREVEARLLGIDQRAFLLHMAAEHLAQRLVHQVRRRVVAHGARARQHVHPGGRRRRR